MENIPRFKAPSFEDGKNSVVGSCNGHSCEERWEVETPAFAKAIAREIPKDAYTILDYGCGVGRIAKAVLKENNKITIIGVDASDDELRHAKGYVDDKRFIPTKPEELSQKVDLIYCIYVLQHVPAIELRHAIERMHYYLKPGGRLIYCSSDYRMAINEHHAFTDDRHLGVDIQREISRLFNEEKDLFDLENEPAIIKDLVTAEGCPQGSIPHPAKVYRRKGLLDEKEPYFKVPFDESAKAGQAEVVSEKPILGKSVSGAPKRLILQNRLSPGDILVMTAAIRSLHLAYPGKFLTDVETPCSEIFENSPYITSLQGEGQKIDMHYPLISNHKMRDLNHPGCGVSGRHFSDGHRKYLEEILEIEIPRTGLLPDIFLTQNEKLWPSPVLKELGFTGRYWCINAGSKKDCELKQYHNYQAVVDKLKGKVQFVQIGAREHNHEALKGVLDMRGKTSHRDLYRTIYHSEGVVSPVSYPMHIAAAFQKPCVVVAGGREPIRWEMYPSHRYLATNGALRCCAHDGCWKSKIEDCVDKVTKNQVQVPKCMTLITPQMVVDAVMMYYAGGILQPIDERELCHV